MYTKVEYLLVNVFFMKDRHTYKLTSFVLLLSGVCFLFFYFSNIESNSYSGYGSVENDNEPNSDKFLYSQLIEYKKALGYLSVSDDPRFTKDFQSMCEGERTKMTQLLEQLDSNNLTDDSRLEIRKILAESSGKVIDHPILERELQQDKTLVMY